MLKIGNTASDGHAKCVRQMQMQMHAKANLPTLPRRHMNKSVPSKLQTLHAHVDAAISESIMSTQVFNVDVIMPTYSFAPIYRVILRYNNWTDDKEVAKLVKQAVPVITYGSAKQVVANSKAYGHGIVVTAVQEDAVQYMNNLLVKGLDADMIEA